MTLRLAKVEAQLAHRDASLGWLELYARSGLDLGDPAALPEFNALRAEARFTALESQYQAGLQPVGPASVFAVLPERDLIAEDLALDARDGSLYVSSVREGRVLRRDGKGAWRDFAGRAALGAWGIYALALDPGRNLIWMGSAAGAVSPPFKPEDRGRSAVLRVGLHDAKVQQRYELHDAREHAFGDMALAADGTLYVSDGLGGGVYRIGPGAGESLEVLVPGGQLRSPQTPVPLPGGARLLVPDYSRGIAIVDLQHGGPLAWLAHPPELALYGIDGLYLRGTTLVAVQNGTQPERLLLLRLDAGCARVLDWKVLLARQPGLGDPTHGVITDRQFRFIANSGWDRVDDEGRLDSSAAATNPALWSLELPD